MKIYLSMAIIGMMIGKNVWAQCVTTQDCSALGYTETSCPNGGVKCPFGDKWACYVATDISDIPEPNEPNVICDIGMLYFSDGTCSTNKQSGKKILGVVIYRKTDSQNGWIISPKSLNETAEWATKDGDVPNLPDYGELSDLNDVHNSCKNTDIITAYGDKTKYQAAWIAKNYNPTGTPVGKSWCLPSGGLLKSIRTSKQFNAIKKGLQKAGGDIGDTAYGTFYNFEYIWSSSGQGANSVWYLYTNELGEFYMGDVYIVNSNSVRAVMEI